MIRLIGYHIEKEATIQDQSKSSAKKMTKRNMMISLINWDYDLPFFVYVEIEDSDSTTSTTNPQMSIITPKTQAAIFSPTLLQQAESPQIATSKGKGGVPQTPSKKDCGNKVFFGGIEFTFLFLFSYFLNKGERKSKLDCLVVMNKKDSYISLIVLQ